MRKARTGCQWYGLSLSVGYLLSNYFVLLLSLSVIDPVTGVAGTALQ